MALFDILINIAANTASFESGMDRIESRLQAFGNVIKGGLEFTGITVGLNELREGLDSAGEGGEQLVQLSSRMRTTVESLSELQYAASTVNVPFQSLIGSINVMQRGLVQAADGSGRAKQAFADLGVDASKLAQLPLDDQLGVIANRIAALPNPTQQAAAAMRIFGGSGADLLPILDQGSAGIEQLRARADALGVTLSGDAAENLAKFNSAMTDLKASSHSLWTELASDSAPVLSGIAKEVTSLITGFKDLTFGFASPEAELANLKDRAAAFQAEIDKLNAGKDNRSILNRVLGLDAGQLETDLDALAKVQAQITKVQAQYDNTLEPVKVTAKLIGGGANDTEQLPLLNFNGDDAMMAKYQDKLVAASKTDVQNTADAWAEKEALAKAAYDQGFIDFTQYSQKVQDLNSEYLKPIEVTAKQISNTGKQVYADMLKFAQSAAQSIQSDFATFLEDPSISSFKKMGDAWLQTLDKMAADAAASAIFKAIFQGDNTPTSGLTGLLGGILTGLFGAGTAASSSNVLSEVLPAAGLNGGLNSLMGFANGGTFNVGGSGGVDSQLVAFKATPGENVQVGQKGGGAPIVVNNYTSVTMPQVTLDDVARASQKTQSATVSKLQDMKRRGKF